MDHGKFAVLSTVDLIYPYFIKALSSLLIRFALLNRINFAREESLGDIGLVNSQHYSNFWW